MEYIDFLLAEGCDASSQDHSGRTAAALDESGRFPQPAAAAAAAIEAASKREDEALSEVWASAGAEDAGDGGGAYAVAFEGWVEIEGRLPGKRPGFGSCCAPAPAPAGADELPAASAAAVSPRGPPAVRWVKSEPSSSRQPPPSLAAGATRRVANVSVMSGRMQRVLQRCDVLLALESVGKGAAAPPPGASPSATTASSLRLWLPRDATARADWLRALSSSSAGSQPGSDAAANDDEDEDDGEKEAPGDGDAPDNAPGDGDAPDDGDAEGAEDVAEMDVGGGGDDDAPSVFVTARELAIITDMVEASEALPDGWETHDDDDGEPYFYHPATGACQWTVPQTGDESASRRATMTTTTTSSRSRRSASAAPPALHGPRAVPADGDGSSGGGGIAIRAVMADWAPADWVAVAAAAEARAPGGGARPPPAPSRAAVADVDIAIVAAEPADAGAPLTNAAEIAGCVALVERGGCSFVAKACARAQAAGAVAVIIVNYADTADDDEPSSGADPDAVKPSAAELIGSAATALFGDGSSGALFGDVPLTSGAEAADDGGERAAASSPNRGLFPLLYTPETEALRMTAITIPVALVSCHNGARLRRLVAASLIVTVPAPAPPRAAVEEGDEDAAAGVRRGRGARRRLRRARRRRARAADDALAAARRGRRRGRRAPRARAPRPVLPALGAARRRRRARRERRGGGGARARRLDPRRRLPRRVRLPARRARRRRGRARALPRGARRVLGLRAALRRARARAPPVGRRRARDAPPRRPDDRAAALPPLRARRARRRRRSAPPPRPRPRATTRARAGPTPTPATRAARARCSSSSRARCSASPSLRRSTAPTPRRRGRRGRRYRRSTPAPRRTTRCSRSSSTRSTPTSCPRRCATSWSRRDRWR